MTNTPVTPDGYNTVNPFIITANAARVIDFIKEVFGAEEVPYSMTIDDDGLVLHCELKVGNAIVMVADRKPDWPATPSLLQVYVSDVNKALDQATELGAEIVTKPTIFLGTLFSRVKDQDGNLWWIYQYLNQEENWDNEGDSGSWEPTEEAIYIHDTLLTAMRSLTK